MQTSDADAAIGFHNALLRWVPNSHTIVRGANDRGLFWERVARDPPRVARWVCRSLAVDISGGRRHHGRDRV